MRTLFRLVCLLLAAVCLCPAVMAEEAAPALRGWDKKEGYVYLTLGTFPQTAEGERLPILWRVLSADGEKAYLLSEYVLEARRIHGDYKEYARKTTAKNPGFGGDFTKTELALYLNGEFAGANFTVGELSLIVPDDTLGSFFLLSSDELKNKDYGFTSNESRKAWGTEYAKANGLFVYGSHRGNHSPYWSRTQSSSNTQGARCIKSQGELGYINVITEDEGVRPACWMDMTKVSILSGAGTLEDPFVLLVPEQPDTAESAPVTQ